jgi:hypothetical protein
MDIMGRQPLYIKIDNTLRHITSATPNRNKSPTASQFPPNIQFEAFLKAALDDDYGDISVAGEMGSVCRLKQKLR